MEMAHSGGAQSGSLNGWMLSHCVTVAVLDEKGHILLMGGRKQLSASFCNDDRALNWSGKTMWGFVFFQFEVCVCVVHQIF